MLLEIRPAIDPPTAILRVVGEMDIATAPLLLQAIQRCFDEGCTTLRVHLDDVTFMDMAGLNALARARAEAALRDARLEVPRWSASVERITKLVGAASLLSPTTSTSSAPR